MGRKKSADLDYFYIYIKAKTHPLADHLAAWLITKYQQSLNG